eukprot:1516782-Heterocapsa_arctica.AAC.1
MMSSCSRRQDSPGSRSGGAKGAATKQGFDAVFAPAMGSVPKGQNLGGVGIMVKNPRKVKQIYPSGETKHFDKGWW